MLQNRQNSHHFASTAYFILLLATSRRLGEAIVPNDVTANHITRHYNLEECVNLINDAMYRETLQHRFL